MAVAQDKTRITVTVRNELLEMIDAAAEREGIPRSQRVAEILEAWHRVDPRYTAPTNGRNKQLEKEKLD